MSKPVFISQLILVLMLAGVSAWLGQQWRHEAVEYQTRKETDGGIEKQRLVSEGEKSKSDTIADFGAKGAALRGTIDGRATAEAGLIEATGETGKTELMSAQDLAMAYTVDALQGIRTTVARFQQLAARENNSDLATDYRTVGAYLQRTAISLQDAQKIAWSGSGTGGDCAKVESQTSKLAFALLDRLK